MIRIAVLGAGRIGRIHAHNAARNPRVQLVAVADLDARSAGSLANATDCEASTDPVGTSEREDVDALIVGTPTDTHVGFLLRGARAGKAVLCEKPVDLDIKRAEAAADEVEHLRARAMVAFNRRFDPSAQAMKNAILEGRIGEVHQVIVTSRDPAPPPTSYIETSGGVFRDMVIHDFDMTRFLLGEEPVEVMATASALTEPHVRQAGDFDVLMVMMRTASGKQASITCHRKAVYGYDQRLEVMGSKGMLLNDNLRPTTLRRYGETETEVQDPILNFFLERYVEAYRNELDLFLDALEKDLPMPVTVRDGCRALRLADAAVESAATGRVVRV
jgi:myo-inositol 2-dehydrogenase/D-chiro-inositol 1-dehydrogenase